MGSWSSALLGFVAGVATAAVVAAYALAYGGPSSQHNVRKHLRGSVVRSVTAEQMGLLTELMKQLWTYIKVAGADSIRETVEPMFPEMMPGPLAKLKFTKIDLGSVPIRMDNVFVHKVNEEENTLQFDLDVIWDGNCDIQLKSGMIAFGVKSVKLIGRMSILLRPLTTDLSIVSGLQYTFINPPHLELDFTGLAQVADFAVVDKHIRKMLQDILASMIVLPERMLYKMEPTCSFKDIYRPPLGIVTVTVQSGRGFVVEKRALRKDDIPDCYAAVTLGNRTVRTHTVKDHLSPVWNESCDFLLCDMDQIIAVDVMDEDGGPMDPDDFLGETTTTVGEVLLEGGVMEFPLVGEDHKPNGTFVTLGCNVTKFSSSDLSSLKDTKEPNALAGVLIVLVMGAQNIPLTKEEVKTFVQVEYGDKKFVTGVVEAAPGIDALNPVYDLAFHIPLAPGMVKNGKVLDVKFTLINGIEDKLGSMVVTHEEIAASSECVVTEIRNIGTQGAKLDFQVALRGVDRSTTATMLSSSTTDASSSVASRALPSKSKVCVTAVSGRGFKIQKKRLRKNDIPDCYCVVQVGTTSHRWRTKTIKDSVSPVWNESKEFIFNGHKQVVDIDVYDENSGRLTKDNYLGKVRFTVGEALLQGGRNGMEVELLKDGKPTGTFVTFQCAMVG